jgi:eukaryotic-like serine/threonine-protein kinase
MVECVQLGTPQRNWGIVHIQRTTDSDLATIYRCDVQRARMAQLSPGTNLSHYRVISTLGAGGMGEVYLAQDAKLDRKVALKILPADLAANQDRMRRFTQEAKAAAALNHPNIAHIYEIGEQQGTNFIAMEFIDGETLSEAIYRRKTDLAKLLRYLQHAAEGLAKAHAAGIVHRDLKPDNIMISRDGHAKLLDFGLAKLVEQQPVPFDGSSEVTAVMPHSLPGKVMGTIGYMSPEQAQGKTKEIDQRSDIFSFGCILFEAVTGKKPFEGDSVIKSLHMVVYEPAPPLAELNPLAPADLQHVLRRCLAKDPDERYQSIKEVAIELKELRRQLAGIDTTVSSPPSGERKAPGAAEGRSGAVTTSERSPSLQTHASNAEYVVSEIKKHKRTAAVALVLVMGAVGIGLYYWKMKSGATIRSVAVMPFVSENSNQDLEYLSDGMTETLISSLSQLPNLNVKARSSVFRYKGKETEPKTIGNELNVQSILNGRVSQHGDELTLTVELVDVQTENVIWSEQYNRTQADLVSLQREVARDVLSKLKTKLSGEDETKVTKTYTADSKAYQLYFKGRFYFNKRTKQDLLSSIEFYKQAIDLDSNFALAYVGIADSYAIMSPYGYAAPNEIFPKAKVAAQQAIKIDPELADAHASYGKILADYDWNWSEAEREFKRSIELNPNIPFTHYQYGAVVLTPIGRFDEAIRELKRALELDPLSVPAAANFANCVRYARKNDLAVQQGTEALRLEPNHPTARVALGFAYAASGMYDEAISICDATLKADPSNQDCLQVVGLAYAKAGRRQESEQVLRKFEELGKTGYSSSYRPAAMYALLGDKDKAFAGLEKALAAHDWDVGRINVDPFLDSLHDDSRFKDLIRRMGFPQ